MENPTIVIKRTKEELRRYNLFSAIERRPVRKIFTFLGPALGAILFLLHFTLLPSLLNLAVGAFLVLYPFLLRRSIISASDQSYNANYMDDFQITLTFNEKDFVSETPEVCQKIMYDEIFKIFDRKDDIIIYLNKYSGLYLSKTAYEERTVEAIISILKREVPNKF